MKPRHVCCWIVLLWLCGCSRKGYLDLFNNTDHTVHVLVDARDIAIAPLTQQLVPLYSTSSFMRIVTEHVTNRYQDVYVPLDWFRDHTVSAQLERNDCIYLVRPGRMLPVTLHDKQPAGYPLVPKP